MAWYTDGYFNIWVNEDYNVDQVSGGHWSIASLGIVRVASVIERLRPAAGDCQLCNCIGEITVTQCNYSNAQTLLNKFSGYDTERVLLHVRFRVIT